MGCSSRFFDLSYYRNRFILICLGLVCHLLSFRPMDLTLERGWCILTA